MDQDTTSGVARATRAGDTHEARLRIVAAINTLQYALDGHTGLREGIDGAELLLDAARAYLD